MSRRTRRTTRVERVRAWCRSRWRTPNPETGYRMTDLSEMLRKRLDAAVRGRGAASVSVIATPGAQPCTRWLPESPTEPVFLAYSITKVFTAVLVMVLREEGLLSLE